MQAEPDVIATTRPLMAIWQAVVVAGFGAVTIWMWLDAIHDWQRFMARPHQKWATISATFMYYGLLLPMCARGVQQYLRHGGRVVWIEDGHLIYHDRSHFSVRCADIASLTYGTNYGADAIGVFLKDGSKKVIRVQGMSISRDEIMKRLQKICGLPDSAVEFPEQG